MFASFPPATLGQHEENHSLASSCLVASFSPAACPVRLQYPRRHYLRRVLLRSNRGCRARSRKLSNGVFEHLLHTISRLVLWKSASIRNCKREGTQVELVLKNRKLSFDVGDRVTGRVLGSATSPLDPIGSYNGT